MFLIELSDAKVFRGVSLLFLSRRMYFRDYIGPFKYNGIVSSWETAYDFILNFKMNTYTLKHLRIMQPTEKCIPIVYQEQRSDLQTACKVIATCLKSNKQIDKEEQGPHLCSLHLRKPWTIVNSNSQPLMELIAFRFLSNILCVCNVSVPLTL